MPINELDLSLCDKRLYEYSEFPLNILIIVVEFWKIASSFFFFTSPCKNEFLTHVGRTIDPHISRENIDAPWTPLIFFDIKSLKDPHRRSNYASFAIFSYFSLSSVARVRLSCIDVHSL